MKQVTFITEVVIKDDKETIIVRDPRSGQVVNISNSTDELASFLAEVIVSLKTKTPASND